MNTPMERTMVYFDMENPQAMAMENRLTVSAEGALKLSAQGFPPKRMQGYPVEIRDMEDGGKVVTLLVKDSPTERLIFDYMVFPDGEKMVFLWKETPKKFS